MATACNQLHVIELLVFVVGACALQHSFFELVGKVTVKGCERNNMQFLRLRLRLSEDLSPNHILKYIKEMSSGSSVYSFQDGTEMVVPAHCFSSEKS
jgi:hypothetical protein